MKITANKQKAPKELSAVAALPSQTSGDGASKRLTAYVVKEFLAEQIGAEPEDLNDEDSFVEDLHMTNADLTDFAHKLESAGVNPTGIDFATIETLGELIDAIGLQV